MFKLTTLTGHKAGPMGSTTLYRTCDHNRDRTLAQACDRTLARARDRTLTRTRDRTLTWTRNRTGFPFYVSPSFWPRP